MFSAETLPGHFCIVAGLFLLCRSTEPHFAQFVPLAVVIFILVEPVLYLATVGLGVFARKPTAGQFVYSFVLYHHLLSFNLFNLLTFFLIFRAVSSVSA